MSDHLRRTAGLIPEYFQKLKEGWDALAGGLVLTGVVALLDWLKVPWFKDAPTWVYVLLLCMGVFLVQFRLWAAEVLRNETTVTPRLERVSLFELVDRLFYGSKTTPPWEDALIVDLSVSIRNDGEACCAFYPAVQLQRRRGNQQWEEVRVKRVSGGGGVKLRGDTRRLLRSLWRPGSRLDIPARDELKVTLSLVLIAEEGASSVIGKDLKLVVPFDIPGFRQMPQLEVSLPKITGYRQPRPSADPASSTASAPAQQP